MRMQTSIQWSPPSTQQCLKQPVRSLGNIVRRKKVWDTVEIVDLCDNRRELRKKRFKPEGSDKYKAVNNNTKRSIKNAKEGCIGEKCSEIDENLRKNTSKRADQLVKDFTSVNQGKATTVQHRSRKCLTEERETLNWWTECCFELRTHYANGDPTVLNCPQMDKEDENPIIPKEVEAAVQSLKKGK